MQIEVALRPVADIAPYSRNARKHSDAAVARLVSIIEEMGWTNPILVDDDGIVAGHKRRLAAQAIYAKGGTIRLPSGKELPAGMVPVLDVTGWSEAQRRAYILADNQTTLESEWDADMLRLELSWLEGSGFDMGLTGFDGSNLTKILLAGERGGNTDPDEVPEVPKVPVTQPGDIWVLGDHRIICGDSTKRETYELLLAGEGVDMVFTDPPYNVNYANTPKDKMRGKNRAIMNDNLGDGFYQFLLDAFTPMVEASRGAIYIAMSSSELDTLQAAFRKAGGKWSTFIIWAKNTFTLGRADYQRQYEPILYGWKDGSKHYWCGARDQGDVWQIAKPRVNDLHPTMKPVELVERAINNSSQPGEIVMDPFGGSGTTLIAAEKTGRKARLIELDPKYADVIVKRWQDFTGKVAVHAATGEKFDEVAGTSKAA